MARGAAVPLYPLRFREIFKLKPWGGTGFRAALKKKSPRGTGESWELAWDGRDVSVVANGAWRGKSLREIFKTQRAAIMGDDPAVRFPDAFPLAVKFLDATGRLSLQVHPPDEFAQRYEGAANGKMEAWVVVHSASAGRVVRGVLPGISQAEFRKALDAGRVEECLNTMEVEPADVIFIPPGTVHTAYGGVVLLEVQQNSDVTYRLSDWGRAGTEARGRPLHLQKALTVTDFFTMGVTKFPPQRLPGPFKRNLLLKCEKFTMELLEPGRTRVRSLMDGKVFRILVVLRGRGAFRYGPKGRLREPFAPAQTFLVPAKIEAFEIAPRGQAAIVCAYI